MNECCLLIFLFYSMVGKMKDEKNLFQFWMFYLLDQMDGLMPMSAFPICFNEFR